MIIFLFLIENICCEPSSDSSLRDGSNEWSQYMFLCRINKNYHQILPLISTVGAIKATYSLNIQQSMVLILML